MKEKKVEKTESTGQKNDTEDSLKSKKKLYSIISIFVALGIALAVLFFIGNNMYAPEKKLAAFEDAVTNEKVEELLELLISADDNFEITAENTAHLITYLNSNPDLLEELENKFTSQFESSQTEKNDYASINLVSSGKRLLFFDDYRFEITPAYIHPMSNSESVNFYINGEPAEEISEYTDKGYGPVMPGHYQIQAEFDRSFVNLEQSAEVDVYETMVNEVIHSFDFPVDEIIAHSDYDDYVLYVNGEKTDIVIHEGEQNIGEFPNDGSVSLFIGKDFPWGEVRSEEVVITEENEVEFVIEHALSDEAKTELMEKMNEVVATYQEALSEQDASLLDEGVTEEMKERLEEHIAEVAKENPDYEGELVRAVYHSEHFSNPEFDKELDAYKMTMRIQHVFHEPNGNLGWLARDPDKDEYTRSRELTVVFNEDNGEWELHQNENLYFVIPEMYKIEFEL